MLHSAETGKDGCGARRANPVQCNRQPDHGHTGLPLKSVGQLNLPASMPLALSDLPVKTRPRPEIPPTAPPRDLSPGDRRVNRPGFFDPRQPMLQRSATDFSALFNV